MAKAETHTFTDYDAAQEAYFEKGWTDGLPIVPPTTEKVEYFLKYAGVKPDEVLGVVPTREVTVYAEGLAANAVMAGCKPDYFPVVVAAARALLEEHGNLHSTTGTLAGASHVMIINGPIRNELDIACKQGCMGPGFRANATMGRALRLMIRNIGRGIPGFLDRATFSSPYRYSYCFGENEEDSPWIPLHVERGFPREQSTVTVASVTQTDAAGGNSQEPLELLEGLAKQTGGVGGDKFLGENNTIIFVVGMEHMRVYAEGKYTKAMMREYLFDKLGRKPGEGMNAGAGSNFTRGVGKPDGILIVAAGGPGIASTQILRPHLSYAITKPIEAPKIKK